MLFLIGCIPLGNIYHCAWPSILLICNFPSLFIYHRFLPFSSCFLRAGYCFLVSQRLFAIKFICCRFVHSLHFTLVIDYNCTFLSAFKWSESIELRQTIHRNRTFAISRRNFRNKFACYANNTVDNLIGERTLIMQ